MVYEWNAAKARANLKKHGFSFEEAATVFLDPLALSFSDPDHSIDEMREITIGCTTGNTIIFVSPCQRGQRLRLISARKATTNERKHYEEAIC